ncbi:hypothetical protein BN134_2215 [Cronobacter dublinensis 1210]|uniref:Uncharacterized protein n=1 Tax=Cronobacter dublinensis 1210 TaxID=1208656 RepID=A0ABP1W7E8_9ENTR|nr:hypothetical protein BN134_2215 [Cronobacter dublinensis 1210]
MVMIKSSLLQTKTKPIHLSSWNVKQSKEKTFASSTLNLKY